MKMRTLGTQGLKVSELGLGCMGLTWAYGPTNEDEAVKVKLPVYAWDELKEMVNAFQFMGERYPESVMKLVDKS
jgi:aryl-alcohol dehydrogenase-like predicted oxidoreductase